MELLVLVVSILGLIPVAYLVHSRVIRKRHKIDFEVGNVSLARVVSPSPQRNDKLALVTYGVTFVSIGPDPVTLKEVVLRYHFDGTREARAEAVLTGHVHGKESVAMANASDRIILAWHNLRDVLVQRHVLSTGGTSSGSAIFVLDAPVDRYRDVARCTLIVTDYSGRKSRHKLAVGPGWYTGIEKGISLVDAPVREVAGIIDWQGIVVGKTSA